MFEKSQVACWENRALRTFFVVTAVFEHIAAVYDTARFRMDLLASSEYFEEDCFVPFLHFYI